MSIFLTRPKSQHVLFLALLMLAAVVGFEYAFQVIHQPLAPRTIVDFEFAWTPANAMQMMDAWGAEGDTAARQSLLIDFGFIPVYALAFAGFTLLAARAASGRVQTLGLWLTLASFAAGLFDAIENLCLLNTLDQAASPSAALLTLAGAMAAIKFALLLAALLYWLLVIALRLKK
jgi:hypothetical protein